MVISAEKSDIVKYYAERDYAAEIFYVVQQHPRGLCDALFRAEPFVDDQQQVLIGLPDTIWFPENAYSSGHRAGCGRQPGVVSVLNPAVFDAVVCDEHGYVERVEVKVPEPDSHWIWGAVTARGAAFRALKRLWDARHREDEFLGHLLNAYIAAGNTVRATFSGEDYMDVGTLDGYHAAQDYLRARKLRRRQQTFEI